MATRTPKQRVSDFSDTAGFLVSSPCGRQWFVSLLAVARDYAEFLMQADGMSEQEAVAAATKEAEFLLTWFAEQLTCWEDIESLGVLVTESTLFKTKAALDRRRGSYTNAMFEGMGACRDGGADESLLAAALAPMTKDMTLQPTTSSAKGA